MSNLERAIGIIGGQTATAVKLGSSQGCVWRWIKRGQAPAKYIQEISKLTRNQVTAEQLLSDHEKVVA